MNQTISAIILAGGQGRRMHHVDKGLTLWRGKSLIEHVIARIAPQVDDIIVNCNRHYEQYQKLGLPIVQDKLKDFQGPLAGVQAALASTKHPYCLVCPCDTPNLPIDLAAQLAAVLESGNTDLVYPRCGERRHYLPVLMKTNLAESLENYLSEGNRSVHGWYRRLRIDTLDCSSQEKAFLNINTAEELSL